MLQKFEYLKILINQLDLFVIKHTVEKRVLSLTKKLLIFASNKHYTLKRELK